VLIDNFAGLLLYTLYVTRLRTYKIKQGDFWISFMFFIPHCSICRLSDSTVLKDVGIEPRTVATSALAGRLLG